MNFWGLISACGLLAPLVTFAIWATVLLSSTFSGMSSRKFPLVKLSSTNPNTPGQLELHSLCTRGWLKCRTLFVASCSPLLPLGSSPLKPSASTLKGVRKMSSTTFNIPAADADDTDPTVSTQTAGVSTPCATNGCWWRKGCETLHLGSRGSTHSIGYATRTATAFRSSPKEPSTDHWVSFPRATIDRIYTSRCDSPRIHPGGFNGDR